jgi:hypothetical protein
MPSTPPVVTGVQAGSAAAAAGLRAGDRIEAIDGAETDNFEDVRRIVAIRPGTDVMIRIERNGRTELVEARLGSQMEKDSFGQQFRTGLLGVYALGQEMRPVPVLELIPEATKYTYTLTATTIVGLKQMIAGERSFDDAGGPVKIAQIAGQQALLGPLHFVQLLALLSINLGFINLLPVLEPAFVSLDDGVAVEARDLVEQLGPKAVHHAHDDDERGDAESDREQADRCDQKNEALALAGKQVAPSDHPLVGVEDHAASLASADSRLSSSFSPVARRFNSTTPPAIPRGPTMTCQGSPMRSIDPSFTPPRSSRSS